MDPTAAVSAQAETQQFDDTPRGWAARWTMEFAAAKHQVEKWHRRADEVLKRYLDVRAAEQSREARLNLFSANTQTMRALLYGKTPAVDVSRRFADSSDDVARVASEMLERVLNTDIEDAEDGYSDALALALDDRLLVGMGNVRCRYECEFEEVEEVPAILRPETGEELAPAVPATQRKRQLPGGACDEEVEVLYVHWRDQLWGPSRTFREVPWWAFKAAMTREELVERFGEDIGDRVPLALRAGGKTSDTDEDAQKASPWSRAEVWEIWHKESRTVFWFVEGFNEILDRKSDPLGLDGFWPFPRPMVANLTTGSFMPLPDYVLAQDLYTEIDQVSTRIKLLEEAIAVRGLYDGSEPAIGKLLKDTSQNELEPVRNWAAFAEKGGIKGHVDWLPLDMIVAALDKLREYRTELIGLLYQVTGMSDIMRGQASTATTATEQAIKAKFASVRVQSFQDEFARFASDVQSIKAEIVSKHFEPETIVARSNIQATPDAQMAQQAAQLIKEQFPSYRIAVKPESVSLTDYAALKQERTEVVGAIAGFLQQAVPMIQLMPQTMPFLLEILQWSVAGLKGAGQIEGVMDRAIQAVKAKQQQDAQNPQQNKPDPRMQVEQFKAQAAAQKQKADVQGDLMREQARVKADMQINAHQAALDAASEEARQRREGLVELARPRLGLWGRMREVWRERHE